MPTILKDDLAWEWIMGDLTDERITEIASTQYPASEMEVCTISPKFQASLEPSEPYDYGEELPALELNF